MVWRRLLLFAVLACFVGGCSLPRPRQSEPRLSYQLQGEPVTASAEAGSPRSCETLRITTPAAAPGLMTSRMAYTSEPPRLDYFARHEWVDTPANMLASMMEQRLDAAGLFAAVITGSSDIHADLRLDSQIRQLVQQFTPAGSTSLLEVKVKLVDIANHVLIDARTFRYAEDADGANPVAGVAAANRAAERFLTDLVEFLGEATSGGDCAAPD